MMKTAIAQINTTVGALDNNVKKIKEWINKAKIQGAELVIFPEMTITGYPPKDLILKKDFVRKNIELLKEIKEASHGIAVIVGFIEEDQGTLYNAAAVFKEKEMIHSYRKIELPNYDVFDEKRYFAEGTDASVFKIGDKTIGLNICEDIWFNRTVDSQAKKGADLIINISASPFHAGKEKIREKLLCTRAKENNLDIIYVNLVGAQDDLIFDGRSYCIDKTGKIIHKLATFKEDLLIIDNFSESGKNDENSITKDIRDALVLGVKDYFGKNGFKKAVVGLSGGIDSALTCAIAVEALGKENVKGISMPSKFSSSGSIDDSQALAANLGIAFEVISIKGIFDKYLESLENEFKGTPFSVAEENIQARIRGNLLMAVSNKHGNIVLSTGNKSELSVGYATLYGDMAGGLAVISDLMKTRVYEVCRFINAEAGKEIIPVSTIEKPPSAELRDNQKDSDSLPEYSILDPILEMYVEQNKSASEIISKGFKEETVLEVIRMVDLNEYKRNQAVLGLRITPHAYGSGRRMPITNRWDKE